MMAQLKGTVNYPRRADMLRRGQLNLRRTRGHGHIFRGSALTKRQALYLAADGIGALSLDVIEEGKVIAQGERPRE
jgi:hypothetical protein